MSKQIPLFLVVGACAYLLDVSLFLCATQLLKFDVDAARILAFAVTMSVTYLLNARFTFQNKLSGSGLTKYVAVQAVGMLLNLGLFWLVIQPGIGLHPVVALTLGSIVGSTFNFLAMRRYVFIDTRPASD